MERPRARAARVWGGLIGDIVAKSCHLTAPPSHQATELLDAILEGYPKSKKQFFVSTGAVAALPGRGQRPESRSVLAVQEEVGIETDEEHNVTLPAAV